MALELQYLGQNVSLFGPNVALTGDPSLDNNALEAAGYLAGTVVSVVVSTDNPDGVAIAPLEGSSLTAQPFGAIITEPGEFANTIGPSGSNRIAVARGHFIGNLYSGSTNQATRAYDTTKTYAVGDTLYVGVKGAWTNVKGATAGTIGQTPLGICTHKPDTTEPWLGVASLF